MRAILSRRSFLASLAAAAAVPGLGRVARRRTLSPSGLNHVVLDVSDPERSVEFYQGLLGMPVQARRGRTAILRIGDGPEYLALRPASPGREPRIGRMGIAVEDFDVERLTAELEGYGVRSAGEGAPADPAMRSWTEHRGPERGGGDEGTRELFLGDPHGIVLQLVDPSHCGGAGPLGNVCGPPRAADPGGPIRLLGLNHFTSNVSDPDRANEFYGSVFGVRPQVYQAASAALDIDAGGPQFLMFTGGGSNLPSAAAPRGRINHVSMAAEAFDTEAILAELAAYGIRPRAEGEGANVPFTSYISMRMPNRGGAPDGTPELYFTDPDGLRIQLQDVTYCGGGGVLGNIC